MNSDFLGFSQHTMEMIVIFGIIIFILGAIIVLYWKHIVIGALALSCLVVLANHKSTVKEPVIEKKEEVVKEVKPVENIVPPDVVEINKVKPIVPAETPVIVQPKIEESKDIRKEFMDKCINLADYTRTQCDELWDDRVKEERELLEETKLKGKKHGHYRKV
jgi:nitrate/TMAO reductase-like tetraheme cytochrome c subunit